MTHRQSLLLQDASRAEGVVHAHAPQQAQQAAEQTAAVAPAEAADRWRSDSRIARKLAGSGAAMPAVQSGVGSDIWDVQLGYQAPAGEPDTHPPAPPGDWADLSERQGTAQVRQPPASSDGSVMRSVQRQAEQLGSVDQDSARTFEHNAGAHIVGADCCPGAGADEDLLSQLLGHLGVGETDNPQSAHSPQQLHDAVASLGTSTAVHTSQQDGFQPAAACDQQPPTTLVAKAGSTAAGLPKPRQNSGMLSVFFPTATPASVPAAELPQHAVGNSKPVLGNIVPELPARHQPPQPISCPEVPQHVSAEPLAEHLPTSGMEDMPAVSTHPSSAPRQDSSRRRRAALQTDTLLLCPITQVRLFCARVIPLIRIAQHQSLP